MNGDAAAIDPRVGHERGRAHALVDQRALGDGAKALGARAVCARRDRHDDAPARRAPVVDRGRVQLLARGCALPRKLECSLAARDARRLQELQNRDHPDTGARKEQHAATVMRTRTRRVPQAARSDRA